MVGIPPLTKITITKNIYFCKYYTNYEEYKDKWEVDYDGDVGLFFYAIADEKEFDDSRDNLVSMVGEGHFEVEYQAGKFVLL